MMNHIFCMKINPYIGNAEIQLDGQMVSSKSQLRRCFIENFFKWYKELPQMLYAEVNDKYMLQVKCVEIQFWILKAVFAENYACKDITFEPVNPVYKISRRIQWLREAAAQLKISLPDIPNYSLNGTKGEEAVITRIFQKMSKDYHKYYSQDHGKINIWIASRNTDIECLRQKLCENDLIIVIDEWNQKTKVKIENCVILTASEARTMEVFEQWINAMILYPYIAYGYERIMHCNKKMSFYCEARTKMLIRDIPVVQSKMPEKIECGKKINIDIEEFPKSTLTLDISDQTVLRQYGSQLKAEKQGTAKINIRSEQGIILLTQTITVFFVNRVTDIDLSLPGGSNVLIGDVLHVSFQYKPQNAVNLNKAVWSYSPQNLLRDLGNGHFETVSSGKCTITLTIENVKKSISVNIMPSPHDIQMVTEVKARLNKTTAGFSASLLPVGSACRRLDVKVIDQKIAIWNQNTKEVIPVAEGVTELVVSAYDAKGNVILQKKCKVEILPEKDIITPHTVPTLLFVCIIAAFLTSGSEIFTICLWAGLGLSIIQVYINVNDYIKKQFTKTDQYELILGVIGFIGFVCSISLNSEMF